MPEERHSRRPDRGTMTTMSTAAGNGQAAREPMRRGDGQPVRVLVVDDESTLTELLSMALRYEGWDVRGAGDGHAAVEIARVFEPDVVVLDIMLPDMDGLAVLRQLRTYVPDVPVLFLTAKDAV